MQGRKTYSHSLKMHIEALEDVSAREAELHRNVESKRLELLRLKKKQLTDRKQRDEALDAAIEELAAKVSQYRAPERTIEPPKSGLVQLKKKSQKGDVVAIDAAE